MNSNPLHRRAVVDASSHSFRLVMAGVVSIASFSPLGRRAAGQDACCFQPSYRLQCETVMEPQVVQRFRLVNETEFVEDEVASFRQVLRTRTEEREYRVAKPVTETSFREERFTVQRPVIETSFREESFTQTRFVEETSEREEQVTSFRPVTETSFVEQQFTIQRPVVETHFQQQQFTVQRPVVETQFQTQQFTAMRPVTTFQNQTVDAGGFVAQQVVQPGQVQFATQWVPRAVQTTGPLGIFSINRGANFLVPQVTPPTVQTQLAYRPNLITQQVAQTSFVPEIQQQQVPVQVMRMQSETVSQQVPVQVTRMQSEVVSQSVPVQTTRMVPVVETRRVPVTVQRPITETMTRRVPVQEQRWVSEEQVRRVPVTKTEIVYETRKEQVEVPFFETEKVIQKVRRPVTRQRWVAFNETVMVPRQVVQRTPVNYYDPFSPAIISGHSSFSMPMGSSSVVTSGAPTVIQPAEAGTSVLKPSESSDDVPKSRLERFEATSPSDKDERDDEGPSLSAPGSDAEDSRSDSPAEADGPSDRDEIKAPSLEANGAGYRIQFRPVFTREI